MFFSLPLVLGFVEEKQHLSVLMMEDYYEPFVGEVDGILGEVPLVLSCCADRRSRLFQGGHTNSQATGVLCGADF